MPNNSNAQPSEVSQLPPLLLQVQEACVEQLQKLLADFFSRCDDSLFEFAETATSNNDQNLYFEAMRELRIRKAQVSKEYLLSLKNRFELLVEPSALNHSNKTWRASPEGGELELVKNDELEESVAIMSIVNRARMNHAEALLQLMARTEHVLHGKKIEADKNPFDPENLLNIFTQCTKSLDLETRLKIFLYKRFDQVVIAELGSVYRNANELFIVGGVLPKLKLKAKNAANDTRNDVPAGDQDNEALTEVSAVSELNELRQLLKNISTRISSLPGAVDFSQFSGGSEMSSNVFHQLLNTEALAPANEDFGSEGQNLNLNSIPQLVSSLLQQQQSLGQPSSLRSADEHTINLVSLFFDFVLDAEDLSIDMQALLSRLQIPVLKIALRDQYLFTTKNHPLRKLINEMAQASYGRDVNREDDEPFFALTNKLVQQLINDPELTEVDFVNLIADLQEFQDNENQKSMALEQRVSQSARNSAMARHARDKLFAILKDKFRQRTTPTAVHDFVYLDWHDIMLTCYLNHGEQSAQWREVEQLVDDLLWSSQLHTDQRSKKRLQRLRSGLYSTIQQRMAAHRQEQPSWGDRLQKIKAMHDIILDGNKAHYEQLLPEDSASVEQEKVKTWADSPAIPNPDFKYLQRIKKLTPGDWLRLSLPGSDTEKYCKVSAYLETDSSFLLVNRFGARVAILDCHSLAHSLQEGNLKIVEDTPIFDQAVANISAKLRGLTQG